jgi:hypothetical protein
LEIVDGECRGTIVDLAPAAQSAIVNPLDNPNRPSSLSICNPQSENPQSPIENPQSI